MECLNQQTAFVFGATTTSISRIHIRRQRAITQTIKAKADTLAARIAAPTIYISVMSWARLSTSNKIGLSH